MRRFSVLSFVLLGLVGLARAEGLLVLHVDFNTLQHDRRALSSLLKRAAADGYNAVLWEIENKIRFDCCPESAAPDAFTKEEFREILAEAKGLGLEPIPLVQSFGHLEWLLKRSRWRRLREVPDMTRCCCPSKPETRQFLRRLLRECLDLFGPDVKRFHLGGDEVWELGKCPVCAKRDPLELYTEHMEALAAELRSRGVRPGCWHDMVFKHAKGDGKYSGLASDYTIWFWDYAYPDRWHAWTVAEDQIREFVRSGREMVFCASSQSWRDDPFLVRYGMHRRNIAGGADLVRREKMTGLCVTSWTIHQGLKELQYPLFDYAAKRYLDPGTDAESDWREIVEKDFGDVAVEVIDAVSDWKLELGDADGRGWYLNKDGEIPPSTGLADRFRGKGEEAKKLARISSEIALRTRDALKVWKGKELTDLGRLAVEAAELKASFQEITARSLLGEKSGEIPWERTKSFYRRGYAPWSAQRATDIIYALHKRDPRDFGDVCLRFGALSDIHVATPESQWIFEKALRKFDEWKADGVLVSGDLADHGLVQQLQLVADSWFRVFPDGKGADGRPVANLMHFGDHDTCRFFWNQKVPASVWSEEERRAGVIMDGDRATIWKKCFREEWTPIQLKTVKGYDFILCHFTFGEEGNPDGDNTPGLAEFFASHDFSRTRPMFLSQHRPPRGTILGPFEIPTDNQDDGRSGRIFADYPNLTVFFGHLHDSAANEKNVWQGRFNAVLSPSLSYAATRGGRENGYNGGDREVYSPKDPPKLMQQHPSGETHHGLFCTVYAKAIVIRRHDFEYDLPMGPDWIVPISSFAIAPTEKPYSSEVRERELAIPGFAVGAQVTVKEIRAKDRAGTMREMLDVTFPPALVNGRANDYEVTVEVGQDDVWRVLAQKRVYSPRYQYSPEMETENVHCWFSRDEIPKGWPIRYVVRPCNSFGGKGQPIRSMEGRPWTSEGRDVWTSR